MKEDVETSGSSELSAVVGALLDTLDDKNEEVRQSVNESLRRIARQNPVVVIHASVYYRELHRKMSTGHLVFLLRVMAETCRDQAACLDVDLASSVGELAAEELTGVGDKEACDLLVALGRAHCTQAMGALLARFESGVVPHPAIIQAMGMLAAGNAFGMVPFIKIIMSVMLPMLGMTKEDRLKHAFCYALGRFFEAINDYLMNIEEAPDPGLSKEAFATEMSLAYDTLAYNWLQSGRDSKIAEAALAALGPILPLLPPDAEGRRLSKLAPVLLNICKKSSARLAAARVLATLLSCATAEDKLALHPLLEQIHHTLSELVSIVPFEASREALLTHYEVLRCSRALITLYPEEGLDRFLQQLKSPVAVQRSRALVVLRHLINTLPAEDDLALHRIALSLQDSLGEGNARQMVGAIAALAARPTLPLSATQRASFVKFMVIHCGCKNGEAEACEEALHLLATTVEGASGWLWPLLLRSLLDPACVASVVPVARALSPLAIKVSRDKDSDALQNDFHGAKVLGRCLELLGNEKNRPALVALLKSTSPLLGRQLKQLWDQKLQELANLLEDENTDDTAYVSQKAQIWEERMVELLEESVTLEGEDWAKEVAGELVGRASMPGVAPLLAAVTPDTSHIQLLVELSRTQARNEDFARAVGIAAKRHPDTVLKLMEESCSIEDSRKVPARLLGLMKDTKAAATAEAAKAGLLRAYAEVARRADAARIFPALDGHVLSWIIRQLNDCKELSTKDAGLVALEQVGGAVHPNRLVGSTGLRVRGPALASLLALLQAPSGHRPLQLYPAILRATISLLRIPPPLSAEEREILLSTILDKVIAACSEITLLLVPAETQQVLDSLGIVCSEVVFDSADALAEVADMLLPWAQSGSAPERKAALSMLRTTLRSYLDSLKYTYPGGKLEPGKLLGRILPRCADHEPALRTLVVDCIALTLSVSARHRSTLPDNNLDQDLSDLKRIIVSEDPNVLFEGVKSLAVAASERVAGGEAVSLAEGLIDGLGSHGEGGLAAGISLAQHFKVRGSDLPHAAAHLTGKIVTRMRLIENQSCRRSAATAVRSLMEHHPQEVIEALLSQPLPLDRGTDECWRELGLNEEMGLQALDLLLGRLKDQVLLEENTTSSLSGKYSTATFSSVASIVALGYLLQSPNSEVLIQKQLPELLSALLTCLAAWLTVEASASVQTTKFGFVPNRESAKVNPLREVYAVLVNVLTAVNSSEASSLLNETVCDSDSGAEESLVSTVRSVVRCLSNKSDTLATLARLLGRLSTSILPAQRAVSATFYAELVGRAGCSDIWLEAILNALHEAKSDSSPLVRKLATIGLTRVAYLESDQIEEHIDSSIAALLDGLEEPAGGEGGNDVALESLRGLATLLSIQRRRPLSPRVVLALKPFVEKENWGMRLAAVSALGAIARGWESTVITPDDDISDHLLGCLPSLTVRLEDSNTSVAKAVKETLYNSASLLQSEPVASVIRSNLGPENEPEIENYLRELIRCMQRELPQRAEELRNAVGRGYSRSESPSTRATSALILGLFGQPRADDTQRLLQLLRDEDSFVRARTARALSLCFTL